MVAQTTPPIKTNIIPINITSIMIIAIGTKNAVLSARKLEVTCTGFF